MQGTTPEQDMLRTSIAQFLEKEAAPSTILRILRERRGYDAALYRQVAELGWLGILIPEAHGGVGLGIREAAVAFEAFGQAPLPGPFFSSAVLGAILVMEGGSEAQQAEILPRIADGSLRVALAAMDAGPGWDPTLVTSELRPGPGGLALTGTKGFVPDAESADLLVCAARDAEADGRLSLVLVEAGAPGVRIEARPAMLLNAVSAVELRVTGIAPDRILGRRGDAWELIERAATIAAPVLCAFMAGGCRRILDFTVEYSRDRWAFGQPIGKFQRVQDHIVEIVNHADAASLLTAELLDATDAGEDVRALSHEVRAVAMEAYYQACNYSHMVHAGPGTDLDHPLMGHTIMSRTLYQYLGDPAYHKRRMMDLLYPVSPPSVS